MRLTEAEKDQRRRDQARVLRELHRSATVFRDKTSLPARQPLDATTYTYSPPPGFGPVRFARHFVAQL